jgi:hypothetical protein
MTRLALLLCACAALTLAAGCRREQPAPAPSPPEATTERPSPPEPAARMPDGEPERADRPPSLEATVDDDAIARYLLYRRGVVDRAALLAPKPDEKPTAPRPANLPMPDELRHELAQAEEEARQEAGLTAPELAAVSQVVADVLTSRQIWKMGGGDARLEASAERVAALPAAERAAAERELAALAAGFARMREAKDARARFGDAAV